MMYEQPRNARGQGVIGRDARECPVTVAQDFVRAKWLASLAETGNSAQSAPPEVMVVDRDLARRTRVAAAFRAEGCHVVETATSLETIDGLIDARYATDIIAVADTEPESIGVELRDYLDMAHADAVVIAVGDPEWTPSRTRIDPSQGQPLLRAGIQSLLLQRKGDQARASR